ncbi:FGGY-family carbohydrate kinase, partial [Sinorhizobium meliloti]
AGGGARTKLWLKIKASVFDTPVLVPQEPECGLMGCAAMAATATGRFSRPDDAADAYVRYADEIAPDPAWVEVYSHVQPVFDRLYHHSMALYDDMDALAARIHPPGTRT